MGEERKSKLEAFLGAFKSKSPMPGVDPAPAVFDQLHLLGVGVRLDGDKLIATGTIGDEARELIKKNKPLLIEHLKPQGAFTTWDNASASQLIEGSKRELAAILTLCTSDKKEAAYDAAWNCIAIALEWMTDSIHKRNAKRLHEHAEWLGWLCREIRGWADGSIPLPPKELDA